MSLDYIFAEASNAHDLDGFAVYQGAPHHRKRHGMESTREEYIIRTSREYSGQTVVSILDNQSGLAVMLIIILYSYCL